MKEITSVTNDLIKNIAKLRNAKERKQQQQFIVEGLRACTTFITNGYKPRFIFVTQDSIEQVKKFFKEDEVIFVTDHVMEKISVSKTPSGILAVFPLPKDPSAQTLSAGLVLAEINDPGNMGTLIRSSAAFGYKSIVVVGGCDPFCPKVIQATAGTLPLVNVFQWSWKELLEYKKDLLLIGLSVKNGKALQTFTQKKCLFVIGNEAHGIKEQWLQNCDQLASLPMTGAVESLNAAIAGSLVLALIQNK